MLSGRRLDLLDPSPLDVEIEDIAHGLARVARWNGQTFGDHAFSVAQHSLLVERILRLQLGDCVPQLRVATLLHDAPEYVIGDLISPFKAVIDAPYKQVEARLHAAIRLRFGLSAELPQALIVRIKKADQAAAYFEATKLAGYMLSDDKEYIADAMLGISNEELACTFDIPIAPGGGPADTDGTAVTYTPSATMMEAQIPKLKAVGDCELNGGDGWFFDSATSPTKVQICPGTCAKLRVGEVHVASGCVPIVGISR